jgi:1,5-anhydro-D-fructose reductase (1,5-anhydro-D-mannitol-forming)
MKTIRWGIIGCGDVTEVKSGPGFYKARNSTLVAVMRRNGALAADYARRHNVPRWHDDAEAIISASDIDAVYIATHPDTHKPYTLRTAKAGKTVYVEKPMAMTHAECVAMVAACRAAGVKLFVGYYRRALPYFLKLRDLIAEGAIGAVRAVVTRQNTRLPPREHLADGKLPWRMDPRRNGGGLFMDMGCHTLDVLDFLFGPIASIHGTAANRAGAYAAEDIVTATYRFASGVEGAGFWCFAADFEDDVTEIIGEKGRIRFASFTFMPIELMRGDTKQIFAVATPAHVHQPLIQTIVDELNGSGTCPSTGETATRTAWAMEQVIAPFREAQRRAGLWPAAAD